MINLCNFLSSEYLSKYLYAHLGEKMEYCSDYGEPGYNIEPIKGVLFADWNDYTPELREYLETIGYDLQWPDEWHIDHCRSKCYRTMPDSYYWQSSIVYCEQSCDFITIDDVREDSSIIFDYFVNDSLYNLQALSKHFLLLVKDDLKEQGFINTIEACSDFYITNDSRINMLCKDLMSEDKCWLIFYTHVGQFESKFIIYYKDLNE